MKRLSNNYAQATEVDYGLFAVEMSDGGWTIADGPGTNLAQPDEMELAGYHVPVRFERKEDAIAVIMNGPDAMFDIAAESEWVCHCVEQGGVICPSYEM